MCASTGNTSASIAAYAARARVKPLVLVPQGKIAAGKMAQAIVHGAQVIMVAATSTTACASRASSPSDYPVALVNSVNPCRSRARRPRRSRSWTSSATPPTSTCCPVGNAGNISAYWKGYVEYEKAGMAPASAHAGAGRPPERHRWSSGGP